MIAFLRTDGTSHEFLKRSGEHHPVGHWPLTDQLTEFDRGIHLPDAYRELLTTVCRRETAADALVEISLAKRNDERLNVHPLQREWLRKTCPITPVIRHVVVAMIVNYLASMIDREFVLRSGYIHYVDICVEMFADPSYNGFNHDDASMAKIYFYLGRVYWLMGEDTIAAYFYMRTVDRSMKAFNTYNFWTIWSHTNLGQLFEAHGDYGEALYHLGLALTGMSHIFPEENSDMEAVQNFLDGAERAILEEPKIEGFGRPEFVQYLHSSIERYFAQASPSTPQQPQHWDIGTIQKPLDGAERAIVEEHGSGTTDLVYLTIDGGVAVYSNQCGNAWSDRVLIESFVKADNLSSVFTLDLLGNGTSCLCWAGPNGAATDELVISYLDLAGGAKPHLLKCWSTGTALTTSIKYTPSTRFYLHDERQGRPWRTKLPFPVHTVSRLVERDEIVSSTRTTKFRYHDGCYDGVEREFRGFGAVEKWEHENFTVTGGKRSLETPTTYTKLWYHTGTVNMGLSPPSADTWSKARLTSAVTPTPESDKQWHESHRALKGRLLRSEVYGLDGSAKADVPYTISETSYDVELVRVTASTKRNAQAAPPSVFRVQPRESLTDHLERLRDESRLEHELILETNLYGDVTKSLRVLYGRQQQQQQQCPPMALKSRAAQQRNHITYTEKTFTRALDVRGVDVDHYYKPALSSTTVFDLEDAPGVKPLLNINEIRRKGIDMLDGTRHIGHMTRTYYKSADLTRRLPLHSIEPFSVVDREYLLAMDSSMIDSLSKQQDISFRQISSPPDVLYKSGGYVELDGDKCAWIPSPETLWEEEENQSSNTTGDAAQTTSSSSLKAARSAFFVPRRSRDVFGHVSKVTMDKFTRLPIETVDAAGNHTTATYDYRVMQPAVVTDPNGNRVAVVYNALGEPTAVAQMGKASEKPVGDSVEGIPCVVSDDDLLSFLRQPSRDMALRPVGQAGSRSISCMKRLALSESAAELLPTFRLNLARTSHAIKGPNRASSDADGAGDVTADIVYYSGRGMSNQQLNLTSWSGGGGDKRDELVWRVANITVHDSSGYAVVVTKPYFSPSHLWRPLADINGQRHLSFCFRDALRRTVCTLQPDHTWTKGRFTPWMNSFHDAGDNLLVTDARTDPDVGFYFERISTDLFIPSWYELHIHSGDKQLQGSARKSAATYAARPRTTHLDSRGKVIETMETGEGYTRTMRTDYDVFGCKMAEYDALDRLNLRTHIVEIADQSGIRRNISFDFKGNCQATDTHLAIEYQSVLDWRRRDVPVDAKPYTIKYSVDALNRQTMIYDASGRVSERTFNLVGNLQTLVSFVVVTSNQGGAKSSYCHVAKATYNPNGQPLQVDYGNTSHSAYTYDEATGRLVQRRTWRDDGTVLEDLTTTYDCLGRVSSTEDRTQQTLFFRNQVVQPLREYWYDVFGRLVRATGRETVDAGADTARSLRQVSASSALVRQAALGSGQASDFCNYVEDYVYDDADNVRFVRHATPDGAIPGWTRFYTYNEPSLLERSKSNNRLSQSRIGSLTERYGYSGGVAGQAGCMTSMTGFSRLQWDQYNRLRCTARQKVNAGAVPETTWYIYDASGKRTRKITTRAAAATNDSTSAKPRIHKETIFLDSLEIHRVYKGDGSTVKTTTNTSLIRAGPEAEDGVPAVADDGNENDDDVGNDDSDCHSERDEQRHDQHPPRQQKPPNDTQPLLRYHCNPSLETDNKGQVVSYEEYTPFGVSVVLACKSQTEAPRRYRFASYRRDRETGLYACGARYYAPWLGRWTSPDPLGLVDGHNTYAYVRNDPVNLVDPGGTMWSSLSSNNQLAQQFVTQARQGVGGGAHQGPPDDPIHRRQGVSMLPSQVNPHKSSRNIEQDLTSHNLAQLYQMQKKDKQDQQPLKTKAVNYIKDNKKELSFNAVGFVGKTVVGVLPVVGTPLAHVVGQTTNYLAGNATQERLNRENRVDLSALHDKGYETGMREGMSRMMEVYMKYSNTNDPRQSAEMLQVAGMMIPTRQNGGGGVGERQGGMDTISEEENSNMFAALESSQISETGMNAQQQGTAGQEDLGADGDEPGNLQVTMIKSSNIRVGCSRPVKYDF
ncbi:hypothetical protein KCU77_g1177, partial [Aureobasidium melanogenum]